MISKIKISEYRNIVVLTGAGISTASGLNTYRGIGSKGKISQTRYLAHVDRLSDNPTAIWQVFNSLRKNCQIAKPNEAHLALAKFEQSIGRFKSFTLITQNIDGLHSKAGSNNVIQLHGRIDRTSCSNSQCDLKSFIDRSVYQKCPVCPKCNSPLKPNVVLFGEQIRLNAEWLVKKALRNCDLFIAIGTSGTVFPAANYVRSAEYVGARTIYLNLEPMNPKNKYFKEEYIGKAEEILPNLFSL